MTKLNLPSAQNDFPKAKRLSTDQYYAFILAGLKSGFDRTAYRKAKKKNAVNVRFILKS